ncbi:MAG TPA: hypothetical protein VN083_07340 [Vicinamibacteria bacterium]|nr:hypothetical protein [Vicinamibacteria bacterium]
MALRSPWGVAVAAAITTGSLVGIALGARSWAFFTGCLMGAVLAAFGSARLRGKRRGRVPQKGKAAADVTLDSDLYDLETDRSTDNQRWPM